ncbi:hypothetical protein KUTeg_005709 [Tegillarca granosa]|uniref:Tyr recombinase domain-containing protein n=1 Tax=Tegillarca granosa TaxID=220873 RepID=A0ABQ9FHH2_TEGGR|nr:hypothetical protein KUTeg_005709 [Tegillarca granosa]
MSAEVESVDGGYSHSNPQSKNERFPRLTVKERENIIENSKSKGTKKMTKYGVNVFTEWLTARKTSTKFEDLPVPVLDQTLKKFYSEVRNTDGKLYAKSTYVGIRAAINRHLSSPPHNKKFNILTDLDFHLSNKMFNSMLKKIQAEGLHKASHYPPITEGDMEKLRSSEILSLGSAKTLQYKVWFSLMLHLGRRGRENLRNFTENTFQVKSDDLGIEYVEMVSSETTKNHQGDLSDKSFETKPRMYATGENDCPVLAFKKYIEKRNPSSQYFFQQPRPRVTESDNIWYTIRPVGEKSLNNFMKQISEAAKLSKVYTNHSVRASTVKILAHAGVPNREIMKITGHKCEASLDSYNADSSDKQKRSYSGVLSGKCLQSESTQTGLMIQPTNLSVKAGAQLSPSFAPHFPPYQQLRIPNVSNLSVSYQKQFEIHNSSVQVRDSFELLSEGRVSAAM